MIVKSAGGRQPRNFPRRKFSSVFFFPPNCQTFVSIRTVLYGHHKRKDQSLNIIFQGMKCSMMFDCPHPSQQSTMATPTFSGLDYFEICKVRNLKWWCSWSVFFNVHSSLINFNSYSEYPTPTPIPDQPEPEPEPELRTAHCHWGKWDLGTAHWGKWDLGRLICYTEQWVRKIFITWIFFQMILTQTSISMSYPNANENPTVQKIMHFPHS